MKLTAKARDAMNRKHHGKAVLVAWGMLLSLSFAMPAMAYVDPEAATPTIETGGSGEVDGQNMSTTQEESEQTDLSNENNANNEENSTESENFADPTEPTEPTNPTATGNLTPDGNGSLTDDFRQELTEKKAGMEFLTVQMRNGQYIYLVIDRDGETENVHFLNPVDAQDLLSMIVEDGGDISGVITTTPTTNNQDASQNQAECICTDQCAFGTISTDCTICAVNFFQCQGVMSPVGDENQAEEDDTNTSEDKEEYFTAYKDIITKSL